MRSLPKIYKAATVFIDQENKVQIKAEPIKKALDEKETFLHEGLDFDAFDEVSNESEKPKGPPKPPPEPPEVKAYRILDDARREADSILIFADATAKSNAQATVDAAKIEAEVIMSETRRTLEEEGKQIRETNREEGYNKGYSEGEKAGEALRAEAQGILEDAIRERDEIRQAVEPDMVNLIVGITGKLLNDAVAINPAVVSALICKGFEGATLSGKVMVRVSEEDYEDVLANQDLIMATVGSAAEVEIVSDLSLKATDCLIETPYGVIDCSLTPQYEALCQNLYYLLRQEQEPNA
jgi:flagellar assembly protein FliH